MRSAGVRCSAIKTLQYLEYRPVRMGVRLPRGSGKKVWLWCQLRQLPLSLVRIILEHVRAPKCPLTAVGFTAVHGPRPTAAALGALRCAPATENQSETQSDLTKIMNWYAITRAKEGYLSAGKQEKKRKACGERSPI
ncbi:hypothetical protein NDU88_009312 [Pleurodeles waltl]|uniref:Uncharacterized protein n=1 Tax=Pleurodeles waltl TaxID=8319 RepID=A0AAV7QX75_PLEWA|nr:hypothetical protein NDU88_009312 [Pleurodeles waltl]